MKIRWKIRTMYKNIIVGLFAFLSLTFSWLDADNVLAQFYEHKYAVVIGINEYQSRHWSQLSYARNDAKGVAKLMEQLGFEVHLLLDDQATRANIVSLLEDYLAPRLKKDDAILFFFAGHGTTRRLGGKDRGYILPSDATDKYASLISMDELRALSDKMGNAKHQAFIMDCCYGGLLTTRNVRVLKSHPNFLKEVGKRPARQILTAGGKDQVVADGGPGGHSVFTGYLIKGIGENLADNNGDNWITFNELVTYLLPAASSSIQTPGYATLPGHEQGEFLFPTPKISTSGSIVVPDSTGILRQSLSLSLGQIDITGNWESEETDEFSHVYFKFDMREEKLLGKVIFPMAIKKILNGKINGDEVSFDVKFEEDSYYYEGEIRGDGIHFWQKDQDGAYVEFTAKRIVDLTESLLQDTKLKQEPGQYLYLYSLDGHNGGVKSLSFGPGEGTWPTGGIRLASAGAEDGKIENWDVATASSWGSDHIFSDEREGYGIAVYCPQVRERGVDLNVIGVAKNCKELMFYDWYKVENFSSGGGGIQEIEGMVSQVAISKNLRFTATAEREGNKKWTIKLRDSDGYPLRTLICKGAVHVLTFSGNGKLLASAESGRSVDTIIKLWDTETGELKRQIDTKLSAGALAYSPGDSLLACGCSKEGKINIWNVASGKLKLALPGDRNARVSSLIFNDAGNLLASGGISSEVIKLWDIANDTLYQTLYNGGPVGALAFSRDGRLLASGDAKKGMIKIWGRPKK